MGVGGTVSVTVGLVVKVGDGVSLGWGVAENEAELASMVCAAAVKMLATAWVWVAALDMLAPQPLIRNAEMARIGYRMLKYFFDMLYSFVFLLCRVFD